MFKFGLIFTILIAKISIAASECEPLIRREGVSVKCENIITEDSVDCHDSPIPRNTVATYTCLHPYHISLNDDIEDGKLTCDKRGRWIGYPQFLAFSCGINCGIPTLWKLNPIGLVVGGTEARREQWPWHASIYARRNRNENFRYICGGTLLKPDNKGFIVLTAAHCLATASGRPRDQDLVKVVLGAEYSNLEENEEVGGSQTHNIRKIILHESYEGKSSNFQADIAMIQLATEVKLTGNVLPACFRRSSQTLVPGTLGEVVGFGRDSPNSDAVSLVLRNVTLPVVNPDKCLEWRGQKLLPQEICAGYDNSQGVCNGDSGGGYMFKRYANGGWRYYIQGIVSHGRKDFETNRDKCDYYSVFTKVTSFATWIRDKVDMLFANVDYEPTPKLPPAPKRPTSQGATRRPTYSTRRPTYSTRRPTYSTRPPLSPSRPQSPPVGNQDYDSISLERHNYYRRMHNAADLRLNVTLKRRAQAYADKLIREGKFENESEMGINKNVYYITGSNVKPERAAESSVNSWYRKIESYNWNNPYYSSFSQVVWKSTTDMGTGIATDGKRTIVVTAYSPPGNILGENGKYFAENVSRKKE